MNSKVYSSDYSAKLYKIGPETDACQTYFFEKDDNFSVIVTHDTYEDSAGKRHEYTVYIAGWEDSDESFYRPTGIFNYINPFKLQMYLNNGDEHINGPSFDMFVEGEW